MAKFTRCDLFVTQHVTGLFIEKKEVSCAVTPVTRWTMSRFIFGDTFVGGQLAAWLHKDLRIKDIRKKWLNLYTMLGLHYAYYNFCRVHSSIRVTPAMESRLQIMSGH